MELETTIVKIIIYLIGFGILIYGGLIGLKKIKTEWNTIPPSNHSREKPRVINIGIKQEGSDTKWITNQSRK